MKIKKRTINALIVATGVILFWRGAWGLLDQYLLPSNPELSYVISLIVGVVLLALTHHLVDQLMP